MSFKNLESSGIQKIISGTRFLTFVSLMLFILLNPALAQLLGVKSMFVRPWTMYSGVAVGVLKGEFLVTKQGQPVRSVSPVQIMNLEQYPLAIGAQHLHWVKSASDLKRFTAKYCEGLDPAAELSFEGLRGTMQGWEQLSATDLCGGSK